MSFYNQVPPWRPGYAIPKYIQAEPPGRGTFTTKWLPRRTISQVNTNYIAQEESQIAGRRLTGRDDVQLGGFVQDYVGWVQDNKLLAASVGLGVWWLLTGNRRVESVLFGRKKRRRR